MNYLSQYYKNLSEQLQEKIKNLEYLLEYAPVEPPKESADDIIVRMQKRLRGEKIDDPKPEQKPSSKPNTPVNPTPSVRPVAAPQPTATPLKEKPVVPNDEEGFIASTTFRDTYTKQYGNKLTQIINDIRQRKTNISPELQQKVNTMYNMPSYSDKDIDRPVSIVIRNNLSPGTIGETSTGAKQIRLAGSAPGLPTRIEDIKTNRQPTLFVSPRKIGDTLAHEFTHTMQNPGTRDSDYPGNPNKRVIDNPTTQKVQDQYINSPNEWPAFATGVKQYYYQNTGKYIGANASDQDIDDMQTWWQDKGKESGKWDYPFESAIMDSLNDPKNKEVNREAFRQIVKNNNKNTDTRMS